MPGFRLARLEVHGKLLSAAREDAALVLNRDPKLGSARGTALRQLLYLFARDDAALMLRRDPRLATDRGQALRQLLYLFARDEAIGLLSAG